MAQRVGKLFNVRLQAVMCAVRVETCGGNVCLRSSSTAKVPSACRTDNAWHGGKGEDCPCHCDNVKLEIVI